MYRQEARRLLNDASFYTKLNSYPTISYQKTVKTTINHFIQAGHLPASASNTSCSKCCKLYIGEMGRRLSDRFAENLRSVRNNDADKPVARHFNAVNHSIYDIKYCAISPISPIAVKDTKSVSFLKLEPFIPTSLTNDFLLFHHIPS